MNKFYYISLLLFPFAIQGQVIDSTWFPNPGISYRTMNSFSDEIAALDDPEKGDNNIWDYSEVSTTNLTDDVFILDPEETSFGDNFPEANIARREENPFFDWEWFFIKEGDTLYNNGFAFIRKISSPPDTFIGFDLERTVLEMVSGFSIGDTLWDSEFLVTRTQHFGTGTLITPSRDTIYECVLLREESSQGNSVKYLWYKDNLDVELMVFEPESSGSPNASLRWTIEISDGRLTTSLTDQTTLPVELWNNEGQIYIQNNDIARELDLLLYNSEGRLVERNSTHLTKNQLFVEEIKNINTAGCYLLLVVDTKSRKFLSRKIFTR